MAGEEEEKVTVLEKYMLIEQTIRKFGLKHMVKFLCEKAEVSRSGYYAWVKAENMRSEREENDWNDYELIKEIWVALEHLLSK
jgi:putative transposase